MKRFGMTLLAVLLVCALSFGAAAETFAAGTYDATAAGRNGDVTLHVTFSEGTITDIAADHEETPGIGLEAIESLIARTLEAQAIPADAVTGAKSASAGSARSTIF